MTTTWTNQNKNIQAGLIIYNQSGTAYDTPGYVYGGSVADTPWVTTSK